MPLRPCVPMTIIDARRDRAARVIVPASEPSMRMAVALAPAALARAVNRANCMSAQVRVQHQELRPWVPITIKVGPSRTRESHDLGTSASSGTAAPQRRAFAPDGNHRKLAQPAEACRWHFGCSFDVATITQRGGRAPA
jgi:hypothetical protein